MKEPDDSTDDVADRIVSTLREQQEQMAEGSRRSFLSKSALAGGSLLALGGAGATVAANGEHEGGSDSGNMAAAGDDEAMFDDVLGTDVDVLNYALTLEHLEYAFYRDHLEEFSASDFQNAEMVQNYSSETDQSVRDYLVTIRDHEKTHVDVLTQAVTLLGGEPVSEAEYDFGVDSVGGFLATARVFEKTGVGAYAGAAPFIESPDLVSAAVSIHSVEANHWSLLNDLNGKTPIPNAFNPSLSQDEVLEAVGPFIQTSDSDGSNGE